MRNLENLPGDRDSGAALLTNVPLGTAHWQALADGAVQPFQVGQLVLGEVSGHTIGTQDDRHVLVVSGARGGKGVSVLIPNLCLWPGSVAVVDPKGENATVTARRRGKGSIYCEGLGQRVLILDPFGTVGTQDDDLADYKVGFNPLDMIRSSGEEAIDVANRIADALVISETSNDPFWEQNARMIIKGLILHVASSHNVLNEERNLVTVRSLLMSGDLDLWRMAQAAGTDAGKSSFLLLAESMENNRSFGGAVAEIGAMLRDLHASEKTRLGVVQVARTSLDFVQSPGMRTCLSKSNFQLSDLKTDPKGVSLFLCLPQRFMETHFRWLRMISTLMIGEMERVRHQPASGHPVLMVLDEFPALQRMRAFENAAAQTAGFGVKFIFVAQSLAQLKDIYKDNWETFVSTSATKLFFCNDDHFTREYASKLIGDREVVREVRSSNESRGRSETSSVGGSESWTINFSREGISRSRSVASNWSDSQGSNVSIGSGRSETIHRRPLASPDEIGRLFGNRQQPTALALIAGYQPLGLTRILYNKNWLLAGLFNPHPDHPLPRTLKQVIADRARYQREQEAARLAALEEAKRKAEEQRQREAAERAAREAKERRERDYRRWVLWLRWIVGLIALALLGALFHWKWTNPEKPRASDYYSECLIIKASDDGAYDACMRRQHLKLSKALNDWQRGQSK